MSNTYLPTKSLDNSLTILLPEIGHRLRYVNRVRSQSYIKNNSTVNMISQFSNNGLSNSSILVRK